MSFKHFARCKISNFFNQENKLSPFILKSLYIKRLESISFILTEFSYKTTSQPLSNHLAKSSKQPLFPNNTIEKSKISKFFKLFFEFIPKMQNFSFSQTFSIIFPNNKSSDT